MYILDVHIIEPEDLELNATVFLWPQKILHAFDLSDKVRLVLLLTIVCQSCFLTIT